MLVVLGVTAVGVCVWLSGRRRHPLHDALQDLPLAELKTAYAALDAALAERRAWAFCEGSGPVLGSRLRSRLSGTVLEVTTHAGVLQLWVYTEQKARELLTLSRAPSVTGLGWVDGQGWVLELLTEHGPLHCRGWQLRYR